MNTDIYKNTDPYPTKPEKPKLSTKLSTNATADDYRHYADALPKLRSASEPGKKEDGTRVHVQYKAFGEATPAAKVAAQRAADLGLPHDRYTGRVSRVWKAKNGDQMLTLYVELERDHQYRSFNLEKGEVLQLVILGD